MFKRLFLLPLLAFSLFSCQTIHYVNGGGAPPHHYELVQWHHIGVLGLAEFSPPVNVKVICEDDGWRAVRTQTNIAQGAVKEIVPYFLNSIMPLTGQVLKIAYSPEEASVACGGS